MMKMKVMGDDGSASLNSVIHRMRTYESAKTELQMAVKAKSVHAVQSDTDGTDAAEVKVTEIELADNLVADSLAEDRLAKDSMDKDSTGEDNLDVVDGSTVEAASAEITLSMETVDRRPVIVSTVERYIPHVSVQHMVGCATDATWKDILGKCVRTA